MVKEYLEGDNANRYQQVFGEITETTPGSGQFNIEDTLPDWLPEIDGKTTKRTENNNYLYNGGTLSNCLDEDVSVKATKTWKAASFQADFENVVVELTLQSRPKTADDDGIWTDAVDEDGNAIKQVKYGFAEEELSACPSTPLYPNLACLAVSWSTDGWRLPCISPRTASIQRKH